MGRAALSANLLGRSASCRSKGFARRPLLTAPADLFFAVVMLGVAFALVVALCLWRADAPRHDDALRDVGQNVERLFGETV